MLFDAVSTENVEYFRFVPSLANPDTAIRVTFRRQNATL